MNYNAILIRYGELHLKGKNRGYFERVLKTNITTRLSKYGVTLEATSGRYILTGFKETDLQKVLLELQRVAGIHSISPCVEVESSSDEIIKTAQELMSKKEGSFRVSVTRGDKSFPTNSMEYSALVGGKILECNHKLKVDLHEPTHTLCVDIRPNKKAYILVDEIMGVGGMPVSTSGHGLVLLSGGIDSPVSAYMMIKRGMKLSAIHFESYPYTSIQAKQKAIDLAKVVAGYNGPMQVYFANIAKIQEEIHKKCHPDYMITLVRRFMLRISEIVATKCHLDCIITGESLAQVASQTIESMTVIGNSMKTDLPLLKPLVGFDKQETIKIAEKIGTFDISIRPYDDCCTVFLPDSPVIKPKLEKVLQEESKLDVDALIDECVKNIEKQIIL